MNATVTRTTNEKISISISGLLLFLAGFLIFMGIITGEIFYTLPFTTRANYISELAAAFPPNPTPQISAAIFNITMIIAGLMIIAASYFLQIARRKLLVTIPLGIFGLGFLGVGIFPGDVAPYHIIFALLIFLAGGIGPITSYKIVSGPLRYIFICFGAIALFFLFFGKFFIPSLGVGGQERWLLYPEVFWIMGLGGYLLGLRMDK